MVAPWPRAVLRTAGPDVRVRDDRIHPASAVTAVKVLFHADLYAPDPNHRRYDVTADDQSFLFINDLSVGAALPLHFTTNVGALYQLKRGK